jgi:regulator of sigma E protease
VDWCLIAVSSELLGMLWMILAVAAGLGLVIFVHELGHFLAAKACGVKVEKFYVGFDIPMGPLPASLLKFRRGETEYGIGILPLGGYVKMLGQDDNPQNQASENERIKVRKSDGSDDAKPAGSEEFVLDPRSYPAKPVWQRMIIISAGVIMNLIFAVIFAAIAYGQGVSYMPCLLGGSAPGDPAWVAGLQGGDKILQVGRHGQPDEQLRFDKDLMIDVTLNGASHPLDILVRRAGQEKPVWLSITPTDRLADSDRPATLGVRPAVTTIVVEAGPAGSESSPDEGYGALQSGDEIIALDGVDLPRDPQTGFVFEHDLDRLLAPRMASPITLTVRRAAGADGKGDSVAATPTRQVTLPPTKLRMTGLVMEPGPVVGVRRESPADKAGFREGDLIVSMAGADLGDPLTLNQRLLPQVGQPVEFTVRREGVAEPVMLQATPVVPASFQDGFSPGSPVGVECLGLAFHLTNVVREVVPDSPAAKAGLRAGDRLVAAVFTKDGERDGEPVELVKGESRSWLGHVWRLVTGQAAPESDAGKDLSNWYFVHSILNLLPDSNLELTYRRGTDTQKTVALEPASSDQFFYPARRVHTKPLSLVRTAESWGEAWSLGYVETEVSVKKVFAVLQRLFTGHISYRSLGGPIMIIRAAGSEASEGVARLLVFLTFLSANLAVLNFLPIPALDGGHMLFLIAEGVRGKPLNERLQVTLTLIGVGCLLGLMVLVFTLDIQRFF